MPTSARGQGAPRRARYWLLAALLIAPSAAFAHGAVSMEKDLCKLMVGPYLMHFTGYQPESTQNEFCEDIPNLGRTIIALDFIDAPLRDMAIEVQILRQSSNSSTPDALVYSAPVKKYPNGSLSIDYPFNEPGNFIGVVRAGAGANAAVAQFPFSVGQSRSRLPLLLGAVVLGVGAIGAFLWVNKSKSRKDGRSAREIES
ncbi:MAG: hypothetical protein HYU77_02090 [Betaproteobacteria bacterium]|nr:hypothetical protein [Betaproteobacteria bacterium]